MWSNENYIIGVEHNTKNMMDYMKALSKFEKGNTTTVTIDRNGKIIRKEIDS